MDQNDETFSSDDDVSDYYTVTHFKQPDGRLVHFPTEYDTKTGENLTIKKAKEMGLNLTPVQIMTAPDGNDVPIENHELDEALKLGLKPKAQQQLDEEAKNEKQKILAGDIGYHPNKYESYAKGLSDIATFNRFPEIVGAYEGAKNVAQGGEFMPAFKQAQLREEGISRNAEMEHPRSYETGKLTSNIAQGVGGSIAELPAIVEKIAPYTLGSFGRNVVGGAALGALEKTGSAENQGTSEKTALLQGAGEGALGSSLGYSLGAATKVGSDAIFGLSNLADKYLPEQSKKAFKASFNGANIEAPEVQDAIRTMSANMAKVGPKVIDDIRSVIGQHKGELIKAAPVIEHAPVLKSINEAQAAYDKLLEETGHNLKIAKGQQPFISAFTAHDQELNKEISRKSHILDSIKDQLGTPDVVLDPIRSKELKESYGVVNNEIENLYHAVKNNQNELSKTLESVQNNPAYWTKEAKPILEAKSILNDAVNKLQATPNDTRMVDELKQSLAQKIYVDNEDVTKTFRGKEILENVRKSAQETIENHIPEIGKKNQAYKDILNAVHPEEVYDKVLLSPSEIESITSGKPTPNAYLKFKNLNDFNQAVQENPQINPEEKLKLDNYISDMLRVSKLSNLAKGVQSGQGKIPAKLGSYLNPKNNSLISTSVAVGKGIGRISKGVYDKLDPKIQTLLQESPKFAADYLKTLPRGTVISIGEQMENKE